MLEILVVMTIIGLLFTFGYASFRDFSRRQALVGIAKQVQGDLRLAQEKALSGEKPSNVNCTAAGQVLNAYNFVVSSSSYTIQADCSGGTVDYETVILPVGISITVSGVTLPPTNTIKFKVLNNGTNIDSAGTAVVTLSQANSPDQVVTVTAAGQIK